jgi:hypothetical protein
MVEVTAPESDAFVLLARREISRSGKSFRPVEVGSAVVTSGCRSSWRVFDPVLGSMTPVHEYDPNTWGPAQADRIIADGEWHNPTPVAPIATP